MSPRPITPTTCFLDTRPDTSLHIMSASSAPDPEGAEGPYPIEPRRRRPSARQARTLDRLLDAAAAEARDLGYDGTTVRGAARRAGVAAATAYTHFASKDHLLAEVMGREMSRLLDAPPARGARPVTRLTAELRRLGTFLAGEPALAAAGALALLQTGPEIAAIRMRMGRAFHDRLAAAIGAAGTGEV